MCWLGQWTISIATSSCSDVIENRKTPPIVVLSLNLLPILHPVFSSDLPIPA